MEVHSLHFWLGHTMAYTGVYSMTHLMNKDADIHARPHTRKNSAESSPSHTSSLPRSPSLSRAISSLCTFFERFSPLGRVYSRVKPFMSIDSFRFPTPLSCNPFTRCFRAWAQPGDVEEATPASRPTSHSRARLFSSLALHVSIAPI